jgi:hypothetical protein
MQNFVKIVKNMPSKIEDEVGSIVSQVKDLDLY